MKLFSHPSVKRTLLIFFSVVSIITVTGFVQITPAFAGETSISQIGIANADFDPQPGPEPGNFAYANRIYIKPGLKFSDKNVNSARICSGKNVQIWVRVDDYGDPLHFDVGVGSVKVWIDGFPAVTTSYGPAAVILLPPIDPELVGTYPKELSPGVHTIRVKYFGDDQLYPDGILVHHSDSEIISKNFYVGCEFSFSAKEIEPKTIPNVPVPVGSVPIQITVKSLDFHTPNGDACTPKGDDPNIVFHKKTTKYEFKYKGNVLKTYPVSKCNVVVVVPKNPNGNYQIFGSLRTIDNEYLYYSNKNIGQIDYSYSIKPADSGLFIETKITWKNGSGGEPCDPSANYDFGLEGLAIEVSKMSPCQFKVEIPWAENLDPKSTSTTLEPAYWLKQTANNYSNIVEKIRKSSLEGLDSYLSNGTGILASIQRPTPDPIFELLDSKFQVLNSKVVPQAKSRYNQDPKKYLACKKFMDLAKIIEVTDKDIKINFSEAETQYDSIGSSRILELNNGLITSAQIVGAVLQLYVNLKSLPKFTTGDLEVLAVKNLHLAKPEILPYFLDLFGAALSAWSVNFNAAAESGSDTNVWKIDPSKVDWNTLIAGVGSAMFTLTNDYEAMNAYKSMQAAWISHIDAPPLTIASSVMTLLQAYLSLVSLYNELDVIEKTVSAGGQGYFNSSQLYARGLLQMKILMPRAQALNNACFGTVKLGLTGTDSNNNISSVTKEIKLQGK